MLDYILKKHKCWASTVNFFAAAAAAMPPIPIGDAELDLPAGKIASFKKLNLVLLFLIKIRKLQKNSRTCRLAINSWGAFVCI